SLNDVACFVFDQTSYSPLWQFWQASGPRLKLSADAAGAQATAGTAPIASNPRDKSMASNFLLPNVPCGVAARIRDVPVKASGGAGCRGDRDSPTAHTYVAQVSSPNTY